jgi:predicted GIY-YIG superfamily endonuclease
MGRQDDDYSFMAEERAASLAAQENYRMTDGKWRFKEWAVKRRKMPLPIDEEFLEKTLALVREDGIKSRINKIKRDIILEQQQSLKGK